MGLGSPNVGRIGSVLALFEDYYPPVSLGSLGSGTSARIPLARPFCGHRGTGQGSFRPAGVLCAFARLASPLRADRHGLLQAESNAPWRQNHSGPIILPQAPVKQAMIPLVAKVHEREVRPVLGKVSG